MDVFLLTQTPLDTVRITTALYKRVELGEWTGDLKKETDNFVEALERASQHVPARDIERIGIFQSFG